MSDFSSQNPSKEQQSDTFGDDNFENDDLISFQHNSKKFDFYYSQLTKYSKHIRETYLFSDIINRFPQEIQKFQEEYQLLPESVDFFFQLLQQNYNFNEDSILTYVQCIDLLKICKFLEIRKLTFKINQYIKTRNIDIDFIIQMLEYEHKTQNDQNAPIKISNEIENLLTSKINECLTNDKFKELPIHIIYRVIKESSPNTINNNKLYDIIIKSLNKFCVLFPFLDLQKLSNDRLEELCEMYSKSNENTQHCFDYLKCNLNLINEINNRKKNLEEMNEEQRNKMKDFETKMTSLQNQFNDSEKANEQLQNQLSDSQNLISQQQNKMTDFETKMTSLQNKFNDSEKVNEQLQNQLSDSQNLISQQHNKMTDLEAKITLLQKQFSDSEKVNKQLQNQINYSKDLEKQISQLQSKLTDTNKQLSALFVIKGKIVASVENGLLINAEIDLKTKGPSLNTSKSKVIVSTSDAECLGSEAYEKGEPITSHHMKLSFCRKPGTYCVRCIVFNTKGESNEIVSNSVKTSVSFLTFGYEGKPCKISLPQGQYKLEVWGAKGGDSTGNGSRSTARGGLGGYSRGILSLTQKEAVYIFVGGEGRPSNSSDGSSTKGGFPDGGGTKTGHYYNYTTVPGTGGGSTSIRIGSETDYTRVIVAGGGGGAGGDYFNENPGGFGGGLSGGNCSYLSSFQSQGAGTQTGSTRGLGERDDRHGDPGTFGSGATGKYNHDCDSGGGGGGGWYGGGSGGYGAYNRCSSGGGGSGWAFTESSLKTWQSGDSQHASKFALTSSYFLSESACYGGNEEFPRPDGNGTERGHTGNGYAKITIL